MEPPKQESSVGEKVPSQSSVKSDFTCVTGYWRVTNKHGNKFNDWFENTLRFNCPYIFFGNKESIEMAKLHRRELPTHYVELNIEEFNTYKYRHNMVTHRIHCPSVELNLIWNEKIFLIQRALEINPFSSEFFFWNDAGISIFRKKTPPLTPFPNPDKMALLPKDKFIYSSSNTWRPEVFKLGIYHLTHHVSGTYLLHKNIIPMFSALYARYMNLINKHDIWTDQVILTHIYKDHPHLFYKLVDGYGGVSKELL